MAEMPEPSPIDSPVDSSDAAEKRGPKREERSSARPNLLRSAGVVGAFTGLSRILGLVRTALMGSLFGTSLTMSAFALAFRVPNLFRRLFGEGALSAAFVPVFIEARKERGEAGAWDLAARVFCLLAVFLTVITALLQIGITLIMWYGPEPTSELGGRLLVAAPLIRLLLPYMVFICLVALCMGMLNSHNRFALPAATPCVLNLIWISVLGFLVWRGRTHVDPGLDPRVFYVAIGIVVAGIVQLMIQFPLLRSLGFRFRWREPGKDPAVKRIFYLLLPAALGASITQVNVMIDSMLAYWIGDYAAAALYFSERLIYLPLGLFATALGTVLLPTFSAQAADLDPGAMGRTITRSLRTLLFVMIPSAIGLGVLAVPIVRMIFEWNAFSDTSVGQVAMALQFYAPGLIVFALAKVFVPAFYGMQDTKTPVKIAACCVLLNLVLNLIFIRTWPEGTKHAGIALATVLAETVYVVVLVFVLRRRIRIEGWRGVFASWGRCLVAGLVMALCAWAVVRGLGSFMEKGKVAQVIVTLCAVLVGVLSYLAATLALRSPELGEVLGAVRRRGRGRS